MLDTDISDTMADAAAGATGCEWHNRDICEQLQYAGIATPSVQDMYDCEREYSRLAVEYVEETRDAELGISEVLP